MKIITIAGFPVLKTSLSSGLILVFSLLPLIILMSPLSACTQAAAGDGSSESKALQASVLDALDQESPEECYAGLLGLHLQYPRALSPMIYLAQIDFASGKTIAAEAWLQAARDSSRDSRVEGSSPDSALDYETQLMWYLSAHSAYERQENLKCLSYLEEMKTGAAPEIPPDDHVRRAELFKLARVLKVRAMMHGNVNSQGGDPKAVCDLLNLVCESSPELLPKEVLLQGADLCSSVNRPETASVLLQYYCRRRAFDPDYWEITAKLCEDCGLDTEASLIRHEAQTFLQPERVASVNFTGADEKLLEAVRCFQSQQWEGAFELLHTLLDEGKLPRHRFAEYMYAVSRLYSRPRERAARENYTRLAELYGDEQLYFVHLYRALSGEFSGAADSNGEAMKLVEQALRGCIAAGPHTEWAGDARSYLAQLAGLPQELEAEPLLKEEMQRLAGFVWEGGSPQLLDPLIETLEWPENRYTLEAGLILRQLRVIPGVDMYIARRGELAGERGKERIRAILQF